MPELLASPERSHEAPASAVAGARDDREASVHESTSGRSTAMHLVLLAGQVLLGLMLTWRRWVDLLVDFGRELYVPQQLAEGAVLYRDIAYFNGPVAPYWNALVVRLGGSPFDAIIASNAIVAIAFLALLYFLLRRFCEASTACLAASGVAWLCMIGQYTDIANYSWFGPYSHEMTHGLLLSLLTITFLIRWHETGGKRTAVAAGLACGLTLLTKCEIGIATLAPVILLCGDRFWQTQCKRREVVQLALFIAATAVPALIAVGLLAQAMPVSEAGAGALGSWLQLGNASVTGNRYYRAVMGLDRPLESLQQIYGWSVLYGAVFVAGGLCACRSWPSLRHQRMAAAALFAIITLAAWSLFDQINWRSMARPWPLLLAGLAIGSTVRIFREHGHTAERQRELAWLAVHVWAGLLLLKILLFVRVTHYGFALAVPTTAIVLATLWEQWPQWIERRGGSAVIARGTAAAVIVSIGFAYGSMACRHQSEHSEWVTNGTFAIRGDARGKLVRRVIDDINASTSPDETLLCLPEGVMLNCLTGRTNPSRYLNFVPADVEMFGEERMIADVIAAEPDCVLLMYRSLSEYGAGPFAQEYCTPLGDWLRTSYEPVTGWGADPLEEAAPGYRLYRRKDAGATGSPQGVPTATSVASGARKS